MPYEILIFVAVEVVVVQRSLRNVLQELVQLAAADVLQMRQRGLCMGWVLLWKKS
jgi:hypothetical protein